LNSFGQGLEVSLLAMVITFLALGVFILVMVVLQRIFPPAAEEQDGDGEAAEAEPEVLSVTSADESEEGAVAAAIAAALNYFQAAGRAQLGSSLREGRVAWWTSRRAEARLGQTERK
jgi:Na+-transporting methylmalonyl-CoA/oxaloacetate decarboxylase gamma subunit